MTKSRNRNGLPRVVVVGGGFAGPNAVKSPKPRSSRRCGPPCRAAHHHLFQPLLYQLATGVVQPADIAHPVRASSAATGAPRMATVAGVDLDAREVLTEAGARFPYDYLVLAAGAITATFDPGGRGARLPQEHAGRAAAPGPPAAPVRAGRQRPPPRSAAGRLHRGRGGGGPTGVEMAGALHELFKHVLVHDFPDLDIRQARVVLLEAMDHLLALFHPSSRQHALDILRAGRGGAARAGPGAGHQGRGRAQGRHRDPHPDAGLGRGGPPTRWPTCSASSRPARAASLSART